MSANRQLNWISEDEYRAGEEHSPVKHEWFRGEVFAMAGGTLNHATIAANITTAARTTLRGRRCTALGGEMRVKIEANGLHTYPDALIYCPPSRFEGRGDNTLLTPTVIFEVLSPSTQEYDRGDKFQFYALIDTLTDYVLVEAERVSIEHFRRTDEGWLLRSYGRRDEVLRFPDLEIELPLGEIYEDLEVSDRADAPHQPLRREED